MGNREIERIKKKRQLTPLRSSSLGLGDPDTGGFVQARYIVECSPVRWSMGRTLDSVTVRYDVVSVRLSKRYL